MKKEIVKTLGMLQVGNLTKDNKVWVGHHSALIYYLCLFEEKLLGRKLSDKEAKDLYRKFGSDWKGEEIDQHEEFPDWDESVYQAHREIMNRRYGYNLH